jgi:heptosyltransferase-2
MTKSDAARVLVVAPNWLGDAVMALPALGDVREHFPAAALAVAARPGVARLFELARGVDEVIELASRGRFSRSALQADADRLRQGGFDVALLLPNSFSSALTVSRAGIGERWGYLTDWRGRLLTRRIPRPRGGHQVAYYRDLVRALGIAPARDPLPIVVTEDDRIAAAERLRELGWDGGRRLVGLAPGAAYGMAKQWPPSSFAALVAMLRDAHGTVAVLVGTGADRHAAAEIARARFATEDLIDLTGRTDLRQLAATMSLCRAFVSNDSGAMHLAAALGVPVTAVFGPTDDRETAPRGRRGGPQPRVVVVNEVWCRPCMLRECPVDHRCMRGLDPSLVAEASAAALRA